MNLALSEPPEDRFSRDEAHNNKDAFGFQVRLLSKGQCHSTLYLVVKRPLLLYLDVGSSYFAIISDS